MPTKLEMRSDFWFSNHVLFKQSIIYSNMPAINSNISDLPSLASINDSVFIRHIHTKIMKAEYFNEFCGS